MHVVPLHYTMIIVPAPRSNPSKCANLPTRLAIGKIGKLESRQYGNDSVVYAWVPLHPLSGDHHVNFAHN